MAQVSSFWVPILWDMSYNSRTGLCKSLYNSVYKFICIYIYNIVYNIYIYVFMYVVYIYV